MLELRNHDDPGLLQRVNPGIGMNRPPSVEGICVGRETFVGLSCHIHHHMQCHIITRATATC
jgi:hypothetical protein